MSATSNTDSVSGPNQGEFHAARPRDEPLTTHGHKPGINVGNDAVPEFHAKTFPPGSAPASNTFTPDSSSEVPGQADNDAVLRSHGKESTQTTASSTLGGATSADVHTGFGHPGQGQTSSELRHGGPTSKKDPVGSTFASGAPSGNMMADERMQESQRGLEKEGGDLAGTKGDKGGEYGASAVPNETFH